MHNLRKLCVFFSGLTVFCWFPSDVNQVYEVFRLQLSVDAMRVALSAAGTPRDVHIDRHRFPLTENVRCKPFKHVTSPGGCNVITCRQTVPCTGLNVSSVDNS